MSNEKYFLDMAFIEVELMNGSTAYFRFDKIAAITNKGKEIRFYLDGDEEGFLINELRGWAKEIAVRDFLTNFDPI